MVPKKLGGKETQKLAGVQNFVVKNEKNQICSKLPEMAKKLVKTIFVLFSQPPKKNVGGVQKKLSIMKKIKVVQNCLKWREHWSKTIFVLFSLPAPQKKIG